MTLCLAPSRGVGGKEPTAIMIYNPAMYHAALTFAWLVATIYATIPLFWLMVHPFAHLLRARRSLYYVKGYGNLAA